jgi:mannose-1-phosphate guanylyltransferase / mannose-6-phosphate isomerase
MLQSIWSRVAPIATAAPIIVANEEHRFMIRSAPRSGCTPSAILLEPGGRNTAPAAAAAALQAVASGGDPILLVLPSDLVITDAAAFCAAVLRAEPAAREARLVTFGGGKSRSRTATATRITVTSSHKSAATP